MSLFFGGMGSFKITFRGIKMKCCLRFVLEAIRPKVPQKPVVVVEKPIAMISCWWGPKSGVQPPPTRMYPNPGRGLTQEIGHLISLIALIDTLDTFFWLNYRASPIWSLSQFLQGVALQNHHFGPTSELQNIQLQYLNLVKPTILQISQFSMSHPNPTKRKKNVLLGTPIQKKNAKPPPPTIRFRTFQYTWNHHPASLSASSCFCQSVSSTSSVASVGNWRLWPSTRGRMS